MKQKKGSAQPAKTVTKPAKSLSKAQMSKVTGARGRPRPPEIIIVN